MKAERTDNKPTTDEGMEAFARKLIESCAGDRNAWLRVVDYGLGTLLENQPLLIEMVIREATRMVDWSKAAPGYVPVHEVRRIFTELRLKLEVA